MLSLGERVAGIFRLVEFAGMFGYYLLIVPATIYLWKWITPRKPNLITVYTAFGLMSITIGSIGSALLFSVWPQLISTYAQATQAQQEVLFSVFQTFNYLLENIINSPNAVAEDYLQYANLLKRLRNYDKAKIWFKKYAELKPEDKKINQLILSCDLINELEDNS